MSEVKSLVLVGRSVWEEAGSGQGEVCVCSLNSRVGSVLPCVEGKERTKEEWDQENIGTKSHGQVGLILFPTPSSGTISLQT